MRASSFHLFCTEALRALARHRLRTGLAGLGIMIGVATVIWVVDLGGAGTRRVEAELQRLGDNLIWVEAGSRNANGVRTGTHGATTLTADDAQAIRREIGLVTRVSENIDGGIQVVTSARNWNTRYRGVAPEYLDIKRFQIAEGACFTHDQMEHAESVVLMGETVRQRLFDGASPVGRIVRIQGFLFEVVGLLAPKGQSGTGQDQDDIIMMPWTTAQVKIRGRSTRWLDDILCSAGAARDLDPAIDRISSLLRQRHRIPAGGDDDFNIRRPDEVINAQIRASRTLATLMTTLALISLVVGGIGILNVMLASVAQRTREIGLRMAVGATPAEVRLQFLGEAVMLSLFGGLAGVALSVVGGMFLEHVFGWQLSTSMGTLAVAIGSSTAVGVSFGSYPAWKAANLDPIVALRSE